MQAPRVLHYVESTSRMGRVAVVMSRQGVVDVVLAAKGVGRNDLMRSIQARFPEAVLIPDNGAHHSWAAAALARVDGAESSLVAPIDLERPTRPGPRCVDSEGARLQV